MRQSSEACPLPYTATTHHKAVQFSCENASTYPDTMQKTTMHHQLSRQQ